MSIHAYVGINELRELSKDHSGYIIQHVKTKDIDEFLVCLMNVLNEYVKENDIFMVPRVTTSKGYEYTVALIIRKNKKIEDKEYVRILRGLNMITGNTITLRKYMEDMENVRHQGN
jgi:hypothetical protein